MDEGSEQCNVTGFEERKEAQAKEYRQSLEAGKGREMAFFSSLQKGSQPC